MVGVIPPKPSGAPGVHNISKPVVYKSSGSAANTGGDDTLNQEKHGQDVEVPDILRLRG